MDANHDIVPTLRMFDGLIMGKAADEIERLRKIASGPGFTPNINLPPIGEGERMKILIEVEVPADWERRLDMQWVVEREIAADRWSWRQWYA